MAMDYYISRWQLPDARNKLGHPFRITQGGALTNRISRQALNRRGRRVCPGMYKEGIVPLLIMVYRGSTWEPSQSWGLQGRPPSRLSIVLF